MITYANPDPTPTAVAYMVRFRAMNDSTARIERLFNERWRAEAFRDDCTERMQATVVPLYEAVQPHG